MSIRLSTGTVAITPIFPMPLAGYQDRQLDWTAIHTPLEANIAVLRDNGYLVAMVTLDLLYAGAELREQILSITGLKSEELFLSASHTHFAPATSHTLPLLGDANQSYVASCAERISGLLRSLLEEAGEPVGMEFRKTRALRSTNRRRLGWRFSKDFPFVRRAVQFRPNMQGEVDVEARVVTLCSLNTAKPLAILWGWSCHPVCFPHRTEVSSDYPGVVRSNLRGRYDCPVLFFQGFSGNIRPPAVGRSRLRRKQIFVRWGIEEWDKWSESIAEAVLDAVGGPGEILTKMVTVREERPLSDFLAAAPKERNLTFHGVRLDKIYFLGAASEPSVEYIGLINRFLPRGADAFPVGCLDDTYGYLPTTQQCREGGYEGGGFLEAFSHSGGMNFDISANAEDAFRELAEKLATG